MPNCGDSGTWTIVWNRTSPAFSTDQSEDVTGFANDAPYLADSNTRNLYSSCDSRQMSTWCLISSGCYIVSVSFTPDNPPDPDPPTTYDCINGACIPNSTYNTPGIYQSLAECELACGTGCNGVCIDHQKWAMIEGLSNQNKVKSCS